MESGGCSTEQKKLKCNECREKFMKKGVMSLMSVAINI